MMFPALQRRSPNLVTPTNQLRIHGNCSQPTFAPQLPRLLVGRRLPNRSATEHALASLMDSQAKQHLFTILSLALFFTAVCGMIVGFTIIRDSVIPVLIHLVSVLAGFATAIIALSKNEKRRSLGWIAFLANLTLLLAGFLC